MDHLHAKFGPLSGLRVVFSGIEIAGPFAGQMFAEWGRGSYLDRKRRLGRHHSRSTELPATFPPQPARAVVKYLQR